MKTFWWLAVGSIFASIATNQSAQSAPFCGRLDQGMAVTESNDARAEIVGNLLLGFGPSRAACAFSVDLSGSKSANCNWAFPYRSDEAKSEFFRMLSVLSTCSDPVFGIETDQNVNHPDTYDLRLLHVNGGEVGLSLKDKVTLQQTYVFLRLTPTQ
jgi:hypothetical protein